MNTTFMMNNPGNRTLSDYPEYVKAIVHVRKAAAVSNRNIGRISDRSFEALNQACAELEARADTLFVDCGFYRAAGVPSLNAVTVRLSELSSIDFDSLTLNQCIVDTAATVNEIVVYDRLEALKTAADTIACAFEGKAQEFSGIVKCGRIGLQDATPVYLSTEILSYAASIREAIDSIGHEQKKWHISHFGSSDLGTGYAIDPDFGQTATLALSELLGRPFSRPVDTYHALNQSGKFLSTHNAIMELAFAVWRPANDLEFLSSGPRGGIRELILPAIAPGSSIMPGKINPTAAELASATSDRVMADHDAMLSALHRSWSANGPLTTVPIKLMMEDTDLLARTCKVFAEKVIRGLKANKEKSQEQAINSPALGLMLVRLLGRQKAQEVIQKALDENLTVKDAALALHAVSPKIADELFDIKKLANSDGNSELMRKYCALSLKDSLV